MTTYLLNSFPNVFLPEAGKSLEIKGLTVERAAEILVERPLDERFETLASKGFRGEIVSGVGHESTAQLYSSVLSKAVGFPVEVPYCKERIAIVPKPGDVVIAGLFTSNIRLAEGERYTEAQILSLPIKWIQVCF